MKTNNDSYQLDIRERIQKMDGLAILTKDEFARLLSTTVAAIGQMQYLNELPKTAFPNKRRACWFVRDVRVWLEAKSLVRDSHVGLNRTEVPPKARIGRPRANEPRKVTAIPPGKASS